LESEEKKNDLPKSRVKKKLESEKKNKTQFGQNQELGRKCRRLKFSRQELKENQKN
jgi:hypothetical protein